MGSIRLRMRQTWKQMILQFTEAKTQNSKITGDKIAISQQQYDVQFSNLTCSNQLIFILLNLRYFRLYMKWFDYIITQLWKEKLRSGTKVVQILSHYVYRCIGMMCLSDSIFTAHLIRIQSLPKVISPFYQRKTFWNTDQLLLRGGSLFSTTVKFAIVHSRTYLCTAKCAKTVGLQIVRYILHIKLYLVSITTTTILLITFCA